MSILDYFPEYKTTATVVRKTPDFVDGAKTGYTDATIGSFDCLYYEGSAAEALVSARFRDTTDAAISVEYDTDIQRDDRITVEGEEYRAKKPITSPHGEMAPDGHMVVALEVFG